MLRKKTNHAHKLGKQPKFEYLKLIEFVLIFKNIDSQVGIACSYVLWALSSNFFLFVLARFVGGISKGNISLSMAIITDVSDVRNRGKAMALVGIAFSIGFILGPM